MYRRILRGLAGLGAQKLGQRMETLFTRKRSALGAVALPAGMCTCTRWRSWGHPAEHISAHWHKTCRGPRRLRFVATITAPGVQYKQVWEGKPWESGYDWHMTKHAAEVEIDAYDAPNGGAEVGHDWRRRQHRHVGYFKSVLAAKRRAEAAIGQWCQRAME